MLLVIFFKVFEEEGCLTLFELLGWMLKLLKTGLKTLDE
jgi:hypothetical protein